MYGMSLIECGALVYTETVYNKAVLDGVKGFDWDLHNVGHVLIP